MYSWSAPPSYTICVRWDVQTRAGPWFFIKFMLKTMLKQAFLYTTYTCSYIYMINFGSVNTGLVCDSCECSLVLSLYVLCLNLCTSWQCQPDWYCCCCYCYDSFSITDLLQVTASIAGPLCFKFIPHLLLFGGSLRGHIQGEGWIKAS